MDVSTEGLLARLEAPCDLQLLGPEELDRLADEVRAFLIDGIPRTGGHFASNLGNVELTIALHHVYDSPRDSIVWDVSHGCYPHKLITGRVDAFPSLKKDGGISGFLSPRESVHDLAATGHAGTGLSTAMGIAWARRRIGDPGRVVAVVGDGSIPSGMSFEALNNLAALDVDLVVVLNDNGWSIDPTPGGLSGLLRSLREGGRHGAFFEDLGLRYVGPVGGHDIRSLVEAIRHARDRGGKTVVHVVTTKGKGFPPAEKDPVRYHALPAPSRDTPPRESFSEVLAESLAARAASDPRVVAVCAGMLGGTGLRRFREAFPDRCFDVGIAEEHAVTFAAGLALQGMRPVVAIYSTFLQRAYDQIVHDVCLPGLPVVLAIDRAGCVGDDGPTHHGMFDIAYLRHIPNMSILAPSSSAELRRHLKAAFEAPGPVAIRYPRGSAPTGDTELFELSCPFGTSRSLRDGGDAAVLAAGAMVPVALEAAELLARRGIEIEVVDARSIKPLDLAGIQRLIERHGAILTLEDHSTLGGFGSAVSETLAGRTGAVEVAGWPDRFIDHGSIATLRRIHRLDPDGVVRRIEALIERRRAASPAASCLRNRRERLPRAPTPDEARALMDEVRAVALGPALEDARARYEGVGRRDAFLWKWVLRGLEVTTLSCVAPELRDEVRDTKALGVMFDVLLDDVADAGSDPELLERLASISRDERCAAPDDPRKQAYVELAEHVWRTLQQRVSRLPRHEELRDLLRYDYDQLMNVMRYSMLINRTPRMINLVEHDLYLPHNMHMMVSATVDLMASPRFDTRDLGRLREVVWHAQHMGRIGNMITTWERELRELDFSSGVFAVALETGALEPEDLERGEREAIRAKLLRSGAEEACLARWRGHREAILRRANEIRSVDVDELVAGLETLIRLHLASRGLK